MKRLFLGIPIPEAVAQTVAGASEQLKVFFRQSRVSWVRKENYHLTLHFLGDVDDPRITALAFALGRGTYPEPFTLELKSVGAFPHLSKPQTLFMETTRHPGATILQERTGHIIEGLGLPVDFRPWHPHVTIGRVREHPSPVVPETIHFRKDMFVVDRFELIESILTEEGSIYETIQSYALVPHLHHPV